jgi:hypothetical protein
VALILPADKSNSTIILKTVDCQQTTKRTSCYSMTPYSKRKARSLSLSEVVIQKQRAATLLGATRLYGFPKVQRGKIIPQAQHQQDWSSDLQPRRSTGNSKDFIHSLDVLRITHVILGSFDIVFFFNKLKKGYPCFGFRISTSTKTTQQSSPRPHILLFL